MAVENVGARRIAGALWLTGLSPILMALTTWQTSGSAGPLLVWARFVAPVVVVAELLVVALVFAAGARLARLADVLPRWAWGALASLVLLTFGHALVGDDPLIGPVRTSLTLVHASFALAIGALALREGPSALWPLFRGLALGGGGYALLAWLYTATVREPAGFNWTGFGLGVTNIRHAAFITVIGGASALALAVLEPRRRVGWLALALVAASFTAWSGSRGGLVATAAGGIATAAAMRTLARPLLAMIGGTLLAGAGLSLPLPVPGGAYGVIRIAGTVATDDVSNGRLVLWRDTLHGIAAHPLLGRGEGQFVYDPAAATQVHHPHQAFLQIAYQWGLVGIALVLLLVGGLWWRVLRAADAVPTLLPPLLVAHVLAVYALYDGILFFTFPSMVMAGAFGACVGVAWSGRDRYLRG